MLSEAPATETFDEALQVLQAAEAAWEADPDSVPACTRVAFARSSVIRIALSVHYGVGAGVLVPKPYQGPHFDYLRALFPLERDESGRCCVFAQRVPNHLCTRGHAFDVECPLHGGNHG